MVKEIELQNGYFALVDDEDFEEVNKSKWYYRKNRKTSLSVTKLITGKTIHLSRVLMKAKDDELITFKDGNSLNLQKENLKKASKKEIMLKRRGKSNSSSKYKGVSWSNTKSKWRAVITVEGKTKNLGFYINEDEAAIAFNKAVLKYIGEDGFINIIGEDNNAIEFIPEKINPARKTNKTGMKGVVKRGNKYAAQFYHNRKQIYLGVFNTIEEAGKAHDKKTYEIYGNEGIFNFPEDYKNVTI